MSNHSHQPDALRTLRHTAEHVMTQAMQDLYGKDKVIPAMWPATDDGFYFDFDTPEGFQLSEKEFKDIEKQMRKIVNKKLPIRQEIVTYAKAKELFADNPYKLEWIEEYGKASNEVSLYWTGDDFVDVCGWPHVANTSELKAFKLMKFAGAYRRWDEKNKMLTRIYGTAFPTKEELDAYVHMLEEAKKRDHRVLGAKLRLFTISQLVGAGLPLFQPNGMIIRKEIEDYLRELHKPKGYLRVCTPHIAKEDLYNTSGHSKHYLDDMFKVHGGTSGEDFYLKPMNCPHHMQIFADNQFSYRDMPIRYFEPAVVYRDEKTGQLSGLTRVRSITQDDGHLFCRVTQLKKEITTIVEIIKEFYKTMGMIDGYWVSLSVRWDEKEKYLGGEDVRNTAEGALKEICEQLHLNYKIIPGEAAFYGPKLDFMFKDAIGRQHQLATVQVDFNLPERFDLSFINEQGEKERPVVIHRAIAGSLERCMGVMIEHFAWAFPLWLAPEQVRIVSVSDVFLPYAEKVLGACKDADLRASIDHSADSFAKKIRNAEMMKVPYILVLGEKEMTDGSVNVRVYKTKEQITMPLNTFIAEKKEERDMRK